MKKYNLFSIIALALILIIPQVSYGAIVQANLGEANMIEVRPIRNEPFIKNTLYPFSVDGQISQSISKEINLKIGNSNLSKTATIARGITLNLDAKPSQGTYFFTGGINDSPPMDGVIYSKSGVGTKADFPQDEGNITLMSSDSNVISCTGTTCSSVNPGTADITISFENNRQLTTCPNGIYWDNANLMNGFGQGNISVVREMSIPVSSLVTSFCGAKTTRGGSGLGLGSPEDKIAYPYTYPNITYSITVAPSSAAPATGGGGGGNTVTNTPPTAQYESTSTINTNTAFARYSYSDAEGDVQTGSQLQVSTDPGFNNIIFNQTYIGNLNVREITGLNPNTTYYPRVRVSNQINGNSAWANGSAFTTLASNEKSILVKPLSAYREDNQVLLNNPPQVQSGEQFILEWSTQTQGNPALHTCKADSGSWTGQTQQWYGTLVNSYKTERVNQIAPNTIGMHTYSLVCRSENVVPSQQPIDKGYTKGLESIGSSPTRGSFFGMNPYGLENTNSNTAAETDYYFEYKLSTQIEVVAPDVTPVLDFTINDTKNPLTLSSESDLNFKWSVTNSDQIRRCTANTSAAIDSPSFSPSWTGRKSKNGGTQILKAPITNKSELYTFNLICEGTGGIVLSQPISVTITPMPLISCNIDKKVVDADNGLVTISGGISNAVGTAPFRWSLDDGQDNIVQEKTTNNINDIVTWEIDYSKAGLSKITPTISFTDSGTVPFNITQTCETITSLGDSTIREVSP